MRLRDIIRYIIYDNRDRPIPVLENFKISMKLTNTNQSPINMRETVFGFFLSQIL